MKNVDSLILNGTEKDCWKKICHALHVEYRKSNSEDLPDVPRIGMVIGIPYLSTNEDIFDVPRTAHSLTIAYGRRKTFKVL